MKETPDPKTPRPDPDIEKLRRARQSFSMKSQAVDSKVKEYEKEASRVRRA